MKMRNKSSIYLSIYEGWTFRPLYGRQWYRDGGVPEQEQDEDGRLVKPVMAYASKTLNASQVCYCTNKALLAVVTAVQVPKCSSCSSCPTIQVLLQQCYLFQELQELILASLKLITSGIKPVIWFFRSFTIYLAVRLLCSRVFYNESRHVLFVVSTE